MNSLEKVTIITVSQRYFCLKILQEYINNQKYKNIIEWIIINNGDKLESNKYNIKYIEYNKNITFDENFEIGLNNSSGDINIRMDDDDFYFDTYIEHCVNKLNKSSNIIAYSDYYYVYDLMINKIFKIKYNNNILAYKKNYIKNTTLVEKLSCEKLMIKIIHNSNNFFPKILTIGGSINGISTEIVAKLEDQLINFLFPKLYLDKYKNIFIENNYLNYDIVYLAGGLGIEWDPSDNKLGGSEQAIVHLTNNWKKLGKKIIVYGNFKTNIKYEDVDYVNWLYFPFEKKIKNLISWRRHGLSLLANNDYHADNLILDFHDNFFTIEDMDSILLKNIFEKVNYINFKSKYHENCFIDFLNKKNIQININNKFNVIENGIRIDNFKINNDIIRNPYRFCYCSSYDRGLEDIIIKLWINIYNKEPKAELHVYYGMDYIFDDNFKNKMMQLLSLPGVMEHGRQSIDMIIREKYLSTFHLYINNCIGEIDCISIKESLITGCIPIISNFGVFNERDGLKYDWDPNNEELCKNIVNDIILKMNNNEIINDLRQELYNSSTIINWNDISIKWLKYII